MSIGDSWGSNYNLRSFLQAVYRYSSRWSNFSCEEGFNPVSSTTANLRNDYWLNKRLQIIGSNGGSTSRSIDRNALILKEDKSRPPVPTPPRFYLPLWAKWVLGSMLSVLLPFWNQKWQELKRIEEEADLIVDEAENVASVVEKAATTVEIMSEKMAENLPENSKLKKTALLVEQVSEATAHDAQLTKEFFHKVDELKHNFDDLEKMVEPVIDKIIQQKSKGK